jgi:putative ABC transport system permease protein
VWGDDDPIGSQVRLGGVTSGPWYTVIGVVGDVRHEDLAAPPIPAVYNAETQFTDSTLVALIKGTSADATALAPAARQALHEIDPTVPVGKTSTLEALVAGTVDQRRFVMRLLGGFAGVALLLAGIGMYGVISYNVAQRTREVGLRMALGATRRDVLRPILSAGGLLVLIGLAVGVAAGIGTTRLLGSLVFGVSPLDASTFAMAAVVLIVVAAAAHYLPARRALSVDPAVALRHS